MASRRVRAFKRWMKSQGIEYSDALHFKDDTEQGISVMALCDLKEGDVVATIPKNACLTVKTSGAREIIEAAGLGGYLGLSVAIMYERSLGQDSPWSGYLQLLPDHESLPFLWSLDEVDSLLSGTELHKTVKQDKPLMYEDWKESILPLLDSTPLKFKSEYFGVEEYFAAKSLIASRSFEIDDYHGFGMVPLADLFNHKTGAEDVHFTSTSSDHESHSDADDNYYVHADAGDDEISTEKSQLDREESSASPNGTNSSGGSDLESSSVSGEDHTVLQMIMVKDVAVGVEVFNTYGLLGNAALLHRYGFTEPDNSYDIVNIDLELVLQWSSSLFSSRYSRARLSLWKRLGYSGSDSQDAEYFEITSDGDPQSELLILLYIMLLPEDAYRKLDLTISTAGSQDEAICVCLSEKNNIPLEKATEMIKELLLTESVCKALHSLADLRESFYGLNSKKDDIEVLRSRSIKDRKLYHSLVLRVSERRILEKLRTCAAIRMKSLKTTKSSSARKRLKRN
ncbi:hypothetical protein Q3G72_023678 [Acer saccharum]|nr:hypothetical protein Q3G72_023678 [Acer saccharum]